MELELLLRSKIFYGLLDKRGREDVLDMVHQYPEEGHVILQLRESVYVVRGLDNVQHFPAGGLV